MAALTQTSLTGTGVRNLTANTLTSSDTFTWTQGTRQVLEPLNTTGGALTVNLLGSAAVAGIDPNGGGTVTYAAGYSTGSIPATTGRVVIPLDSIQGYLAGGTVTVTGGTGITAYLLGY